MYTSSSALKSKCQNINCFKILIQVLLVTKHKESLMPLEKNVWHFTLKGYKQSKILTRGLCFLSSWRAQFSTHFDELVGVYTWWRYGDEFGNWINKLVAKGNLKHPGSFTMSAREEAQHHTVHIIHPFLCSNPYWQLQQLFSSVGN